MIDDKTYYIKENILVKEEKDVVKETTKYVRTSVTVYKNETESKIKSFIKTQKNFLNYKIFYKNPCNSCEGFV